MEMIKGIDLILQNPIVRWFLLAATVILVAVTVYSAIRQKALGIQLDLAKGANAQYVAAASVAEAQRVELELKVKAAVGEIKKINADYAARIDKLTKNRITATDCAGMVAESVRLLQEGENETAD